MRYPIIICLLSLLMACTDQKATLVKDIDSLTTVMKEESFPSAENMDKIVDLYDQYIQAYPEDEATFDYMELKAKYLGANNKNEEAIKAYEDIALKYPGSDRSADALFMQAFIYENNLMDKNAAEAFYRKFIDQFPNHELADDARFSIENLNLSDEELFEKLIKLNSESLSEDSI